MIKKYTAWTHDIHELSGDRDDVHVLVRYVDHLAIVRQYEERIAQIGRDELALRREGKIEVNSPFGPSDNVHIRNPRCSCSMCYPADGGAEP